MKNIYLFTALAMLLVLFSCNKDDSSPTITYPSTGFYGNNVLDTSNVIEKEEQYSLAVELGEGAELKIVIEDLGDYAWGYGPSSNENWAIQTFDLINNKQVFNSVNHNSKCDLRINFYTKKFQLNVYENGSQQPTFSKVYNP